MPRTYLGSNPKVAPIASATKSKVAEFKPDIKPWEDGKLLHDAKQAAEILTQQLGDGYSYDKLLELVKQLGDDYKGKVWFRRGNRIKFNIHAVIQWQLQGGD